jgi:hypothetical protein
MEANIHTKEAFKHTLQRENNFSTILHKKIRGKKKYT